MEERARLLASGLRIRDEGSLLTHPSNIVRTVGVASSPRPRALVGLFLRRFERENCGQIERTYDGSFGTNWVEKFTE
jgi:hypothetical protein